MFYYKVTFLISSFVDNLLDIVLSELLITLSSLKLNSQKYILIIVLLKSELIVHIDYNIYPSDIFL